MACLPPASWGDFPHMITPKANQSIPAHTRHAWSGYTVTDCCNVWTTDLCFELPFWVLLSSCIIMKICSLPFAIQSASLLSSSEVSSARIVGALMLDPISLLPDIVLLRTLGYTIPDFCLWATFCPQQLLLWRLVTPCPISTLYCEQLLLQGSGVYYSAVQKLATVLMCIVVTSFKHWC